MNKTDLRMAECALVAAIDGQDDKLARHITTLANNVTSLMTTAEAAWWLYYRIAMGLPPEVGAELMKRIEKRQYAMQEANPESPINKYRDAQAQNTQIAQTAKD